MRPVAPSSAAATSGLALARLPVKWLLSRRASLAALRPEAQAPIGAGRPRAAGAKEHDPRQVRVGQSAPEAPAPAPSISVVPDQPITRANHGVDRPDALRLLRERIEKRDHGLLARIGDVQPGESHDAGRLDEAGQTLHPPPPPIQAPHPLQPPHTTAPP